MMLYGEKIKVLGGLLLVFSFLVLACCNKKNIENKKFTTNKKTKQLITTTKEKYTEKTTHKTTEKEIKSTPKTELITTIIDNVGDNEIVFEVSSEKENISTTNVPTTTDYIINEPISQPTQTVSEPATDSDGWVTQWY